MSIGSGPAAAVDSTFLAQRVSIRPIEHAANGQFRLSQQWTAPATAANNSTQFSMRWGSATKLFVLQYLKLQAQQSAPFTATQLYTAQMFVARPFTVSDSAGGVISTVKRRTSHAASLITDIRVSTVAAGLTVGTRTVDATAFLGISGIGRITTVNEVTYTSEMAETATGGRFGPVIPRHGLGRG
jgi:hypothetical protein